MFARRPVRRLGSALIVTLGVLMVLAILAVSFSRIMIPERDAAKQFSWSVQAGMAAHSGVERSMSALQREIVTGTIQDMNAPWRYFGEDKNRDYLDGPGEDTNLNGIVERQDCPIEQATTPSFQVPGTDYSGLVNNPGLPAGYSVRYRLKVVDAQSMINLNNNYRDFAEFLNNFGRFLRTYLAMGRDIIAGARYNGKTGAAAILDWRTRMGGVFKSKRQLIPILQNGEKDLELLDGFITAYNWEDTFAVNDSRVDADPNWWNKQWNDFGWLRNGMYNFWGPAMPKGVPRYPININTAPRPVLAAAFRTFMGYFPLDESEGALYDSFRMRAPSDYVVQAWKTWTSDGFANALARMVVTYRSGNEKDANGDGWPNPGEDTNRNGILDKGPFLSYQDWNHFIQTYIGYGAAFESALHPIAQLQRYNPDYMPTAWFHEKDGRKWFHIGDVYLADKCYVEKQPPELALRSHGFYEITSLGMVYNPAGEQIASRIVATAIRSYHPIRHSTQKDFMSKPSGTSWKTGDAYPSAPWTDSDVSNWAVNTTTFPENIWDNRNGSQATSEPGKADPWTGGVELTPMDDPAAGATFFTNYRHHIEANPPSAGDRQYYLESNTRDAYATTKTLQDRSVHNASTTQGSDLFPDGLYHNQWRRWRATVYKNGAYNVASYQKMRPDQGTLEMWYKIETHWFGGEIFTAFQPCVSTFAQQPSEGIQHRVYLGYVPFRCGFGGCFPVDQPYRWHGSPEVQSSRGVLCVPVICAERIYYTASINLGTGAIYGRDAGYQNRQATGFFNINGSVVQLASANFVDYEYFPCLNWGRDKMWHHLYMTWRAGTDIEFYMDGVRAPYRTTVTNTAYGAGHIVLPWYGYNDMPPELHVGGTRKFEVPQRNLSLGAGFGWSAPSLQVVWPRPLRYWYDFTPSGPTDWKADGTLDWIRIFQAAGAGARRNRFEPISANYVGAYRNQMKMPQDATRIVYMAWNEQIPTWNPAIDPGPYYYGRYIYPNQRPDVILELRTAAGTWRFDEPTLQAAPFNMTAEQARNAAHGSGVPLNAIVQPGEVVTYTAYFRNNGNVTPLQVTPILEDVTLFYFTKAPATFFWEEY